MASPPSDTPAPEKKSGRLRYLLVVAVPAALLLGLLIFGYQQLLAGRQRYFIESYIRALGSLAEQTEGAVDALSSAYGNAVREWAQGGKRNCADLAKQLKLIPLSLAEGSAKTCAANPKGDGRKFGDQVRVGAVSSSTRLRQTGDGTHSVDRSVVEEPLVETADASLQFCLGDSSSSKGGELCAEKRLSDLLRPYFAGSPIKHLDTFLVDGDGRVLFERGNSGLRLAQLPSEASAGRDGGEADGKGATATQGLPTKAEVQAATIVRKITIQGTSYLLFSQPLRLRDGAAQQTATTWAVGILVREDRMENEGERLPLSVVAGIPLVLLAALLILPFVRLATIGEREPLTALGVAGLALGTTLGIALACAAALHWYAYRSLGARADREMRAVATAIERNFADEIALATTTLAKVSDRYWLPRRDEAVESGLGQYSYIGCTNLFDDKERACRGQLKGRRGVNAEDRKVDRFDADARRIFGSYPWFDMLVLVDSDGTQLEKWAVAATTTPQVDMSEHRAWKDVVGRRLLRAKGLSKWSGVALNVMTSPNTGKMLSLLSIPVDEERPTRVAMIVTDMLSVTNPMLPPDFGFAIVDQQGRVLFHSTQRLRLYENFFAETSPNLPIRSALFSSKPGFYNIEYHGQPQRALVESLAGTEWALIVFRDRDLLRMVHAEVGFVVVVSLLVLVGLYALWFAFARALLGPSVFLAIQPNPRAVPRYWMLFAPLVLLIGWVVAAMRADNGLVGEACALLGGFIGFSGLVLVLVPGLGVSNRRWIAGAFVLALMFVFAFWLSWPAAAEKLDWYAFALLLAAAAVHLVVLAGWEPSWIEAPRGVGASLSGIYSTLALLLLVLLAVLPAAALFRDSFETHAATMARARQLRFGDSLATNEKRLARQKEDANWRVATEKARARVEQWVLVGRRAFHTAGLGPSARPLSSPWLEKRKPAASATQAGLCSDPDMRAPACANAAGTYVFDPAYERCLQVRRGLSALLLAALPIFTQESAWIRTADTPQVPTCGRLPSQRGGLQVEPLWAGLDPIMVPAWSTALQWPSTAAAWLLTGLLAGLAALGLWWLLRWVVRSVCNLEVWETAVLGDQVETGRGEYWIRPSALVRERLRARAQRWIDCESLSDPAELASAIPDDETGRIVIANIEDRLGTPAWDSAKLQLLERLVVRRRQVIDVVSAVDLLPRLAAEAATDVAAPAAEPPGDALSRWARVLAALDKRRADLPPAPLPPRAGAAARLYAECRWTPRLRGIRAAILADARWTALSEDRLVEHIGDLADAHYRVLWDQLAEQERLVLFHLASTGFVNPKNRRLAQSLMRRGMIRRTPLLRLMNESFRRFVCAAEERATIRSWERAAGASVWVWIRNVVLGVVIAGAIFLFLTQPESYAKWAALLTALTTVGGGVTTLLGFFQARRTPAAG